MGRHLRALEPNLGGGAGSPPEVAVASERPRTEKLGRDLSIHTQRRKWQSRADTWDRHNDVGMSKVASMAVEAAKVRPGADCVDLGCGGGRLALALAREGANVLGVDVSESMIRRMEAQAAEEGLHSVRGMVAPIEHLELPAASLDLVVTNYALHHLLDGEKEKVVRAAAQWLRPGGRLVVADLMLGRGAARDGQGSDHRFPQWLPSPFGEFAGGPRITRIGARTGHHQQCACRRARRRQLPRRARGLKVTRRAA